MAKVMDTIY
jgi:hypothetical protein